MTPSVVCQKALSFLNPVRVSGRIRSGLTSWCDSMPRILDVAMFRAYLNSLFATSCRYSASISSAMRSVMSKSCPSSIVMTSPVLALFRSLITYALQPPRGKCLASIFRACAFGMRWYSRLRTARSSAVVVSDQYMIGPIVEVNSCVISPDLTWIFARKVAPSGVGPCTYCSSACSSVSVRPKISFIRARV
jgi:hypothetical protein